MIANTSDPYISLIVLAWNRWELTLRCLDTLLQSVGAPLAERGVEVVVVDNGSDEAARRLLLAYAPPALPPGMSLRVLPLAENRGYPCGVNAGLAESRGRLVGVLNNDLEFPRGWLEPLVRALEEDRLIGFAAPFLSYAPSVQHVPQTFADTAQLQAFFDKFTGENAGKQLETDKVIGACMLCRRDVLDTVGGNDGWYGIGNYDDDDWCLRARIAGYRIVVVGGSYVHHIGHGTFGQEPLLFQAALRMNRDKFLRKWKLLPDTQRPGPALWKEAIERTRYQRALHYMPFRPGDFSPPLPQSKRPTEADGLRRWLVCADWTSPGSGWPCAVSTLLRYATGIHLLLWVPAAIFDTKQAAELVNGALRGAPQPVSRPSRVTLVTSDVPPVETLRFLSVHEALVRVDNDFVNLAMRLLAESASLPVVDPREAEAGGLPGAEFKKET